MCVYVCSCVHVCINSLLLLNAKPAFKTPLISLGEDIGFSDLMLSQVGSGLSL